MLKCGLPSSVIKCKETIKYGIILWKRKIYFVDMMK